MFHMHRHRAIIGIVSLSQTGEQVAIADDAFGCGRDRDHQAAYGSFNHTRRRYGNALFRPSLNHI
jgi:hypothetical protein